MTAISIRRSAPRHDLQRGFTLIELMIALLIALFLIGGLLTLTSAMKRTGGIQSGLSQLHDGERQALSLMTDTIQSSGYFAFPTPLPTAPPTPASTFLATGSFATAGQTIYGTDGGVAAAQTDTISVRYTTAGGDGVLNCLGATSATAASWIATFQIDTVGNNLQCKLTNVTTGAAATTVNLVANVQYMQIMYGVQTNTASGTYSVDTYLTATQMTNSDWTNVISVQVTLWFKNPLYCTTTCQAGQQTTQPPTVSVTRTIALMDKAGVNT